jgi:hypothetical protein
MVNRKPTTTKEADYEKFEVDAEPWRSKAAFHASKPRRVDAPLEA